MTLEKKLTLNNVLYMQIYNNLMFGSLLNNHGFQMVFKSSKIVLSKDGMYVGKGYVSMGYLSLL